MRRLILFPFLLLMAQTALGQGIIIVPDTPRARPEGAVYLRQIKLDVRIEGQTAVTRVEHTFFNPTNRRLEGTFYHPLPKEATITNFHLWVGGVKTPGEVLPRDQARNIYEGIVRKMRDPGLLEFVGQGLFKARIFPIEPHADQKVEIEYAQVLRAEGGLIRYAYPFRLRGVSANRLQNAVIVANIEETVPLRSVYSPSHKIDVQNRGPQRATAGYESTGRGLDRDFVLYFSVSPKDLSVHLLPHKTPGEDGYFLLLVSPPRSAEASERLPKDVIFVIDTSGSMRQQRRLLQAKRALRYGIQGLGARDRFNLISFSTGVYPMARRLVPATGENKERALGAVDRLVARGGTHISKALEEALQDFEENSEAGRPRLIVFLTDGKPTMGITNRNELLSAITRRNRQQVRIFSFGIGVDLSTRLLDELSEQNHGSSNYVDPGANMELEMSSFFDKVDYPALSGVRLDIDGIDVYDIYPTELQDLFFGEQLTILGRYRNSGRATVTISGWKEDQKATYDFPKLQFPRKVRHEFVPQLWAARRIAYLLEEIRKNGENQELIDEIVELGQRYGIPSPYASYLVVEDSEMNRIARPPAKRRSRWTITGDGSRDFEKGADKDAWDGRAFGSSAPMAAPSSEAKAEAEESRKMRETITSGADEGAGAVVLSKKIAQQKKADRLDQTTAESVKQAAGRSFYLRGGVWVEAALLGKKTDGIIRIEALGDGYFELASHSEDLAEILSVGERVRFRWNKTTVEVGPKGEDELTPKSKRLLGLD